MRPYVMTYAVMAKCTDGLVHSQSFYGRGCASAARRRERLITTSDDVHLYTDCRDICYLAERVYYEDPRQITCLFCLRYWFENVLSCG